MPQHAQFASASEHKQKQSQLTHVEIDGDLELLGCEIPSEMEVEMGMGMEMGTSDRTSGVWAVRLMSGTDFRTPQPAAVILPSFSVRRTSR